MSRLAPPRRARAPARRVAAYLATRTRFGIKFGLETIGALVDALGRPQTRYATLLVAGTNGKGSVTAYADAALRASGLKVGRYTSPHLVRVNERIVVSGREIRDPDLERAIGRVRQAAEALVQAGRIPAHPTYFEALTAAAFDHFRREGVDVAVLEVGMGGRLDATNVALPLASAIVHIDIDHEAYLGTTLAAIAAEKAGVLRAGRTTVAGPLPPEARAAVAVRAAEIGARLVDAGADVDWRDRGETIDLRTPLGEYAGLRPLPGAHQRDNLIVAVRLLEEAHAAGLPIALDRASSGIGRVRWPGRLELVPGDPPLLLDGAHNASGARALAAHLEGRGPFVLVFGVMADKDVREIAEILFPRADSVVLTKPKGGRAASPEEIVARAGPVAARAHRAASLRAALVRARGLTPPGGTMVVAGSLYLVGEVLALKRPRKWSRASGSSHRAGPR
jgi:dihydrofolate synthase / folylpolyglutamate synthase